MSKRSKCATQWSTVSTSISGAVNFFPPYRGNIWLEILMPRSASVQLMPSLPHVGSIWLHRDWFSAKRMGRIGFQIPSISEPDYLFPAALTNQSATKFWHAKPEMKWAAHGLAACWPSKGGLVCRIAFARDTLYPPEWWQMNFNWVKGFDQVIHCGAVPHGIPTWI